MVSPLVCSLLPEDGATVNPPSSPSLTSYKGVPSTMYPCCPYSKAHQPVLFRTPSTSPTHPGFCSIALSIASFMLGVPIGIPKTTWILSFPLTLVSPFLRLAASFPRGTFFVEITVKSVSLVVQLVAANANIAHAIKNLAFMFLLVLCYCLHPLTRFDYSRFCVQR